jgi:hypothetical protein
MTVTNVHIDSDNKWQLVITGQERNKEVRTYCAIPPTNGNRIDIITPCELEQGYRYDQGCIVIEIKMGVANVHLFN